MARRTTKVKHARTRGRCERAGAAARTTRQAACPPWSRGRDSRGREASRAAGNSACLRTLSRIRQHGHRAAGTKSRGRFRRPIIELRTTVSVCSTICSNFSDVNLSCFEYAIKMTAPRGTTRAFVNVCYDGGQMSSPTPQTELPGLPRLGLLPRGLAACKTLAIWRLQTLEVLV